MALIEKLNAIGDAIREKTGKTELLTLDEMPTEIGAIEAGGGGVELPEKAYSITGDCSYRFAYGGWDWFINEFGDKVTTQDINNCQHMFNSSQVKEIPFEINCSSKASSIPFQSMFSGCNNLESVPRIKGFSAKDFKYIFSQCHRLKEIPEDITTWFDWNYIDNMTGGYTCDRSNMFYFCCSLRKIPMDFLMHGNPQGTYSISIYCYGFYSCYALDEIVGLPNPHLNATWTSNAFASTFGQCSRLKNITFATPNGAPYVVNWKNQTIDLSYYVGYAMSDSVILNYDSGISANKKVDSADTYQALKDDPDWFTTNLAYSRYNHDSAVATINSLPDTSAYLATAGGTNTIKFKGAAGSSTDGGAINTLTEEEIAVATAKGWTVTLV